MRIGRNVYKRIPDKYYSKDTLITCTISKRTPSVTELFNNPLSVNVLLPENGRINSQGFSLNTSNKFTVYFVNNIL